MKSPQDPIGKTKNSERPQPSSILGTVQQTLLSPLLSRANEYGRTDAIICDSKARELIDQLDYDFDRISPYRDTLIGTAIRAAILDRWITEFLDRCPDGTIVLVGEGLDTTFDRNDNGRAQWLEIDYPDVIELREKLFEANDRRLRFSGSVFEPGWSDLINVSGDQVLFQIAGVTMYLRPEQVRRLFIRLADEFPGCQVMFDTCSELGKKNASRWEATVRTTGAKYQFGIDDPSTICLWDDRLRVTDCEALMDHHRERWTLKTRVVSTLWPRLRRSYLVNRCVFDPRR